MNKKYELTGETKTIQGENGAVTLHRIRAVTPFVNVKAGQIGGWIESEQNLSQEGNAWVYDNASVYGNAMVNGDAWIFGNTQVSGEARVSGNARLYDACRVYGNAWVYDGARVFDEAKVFGNSEIHDSCFVHGNAQVYEHANVSGDAQVSGKARVYGDAKISGKAKVYGNAQVNEDMVVDGDACITEHNEAGAENISELVQTLEENDMPEHAGMLKDLYEQVDTMSAQLQEMSVRLSEAQWQLREYGIDVHEAVSELKTRNRTLQERLSDIRKSITRKAADIMESVKKVGRKALYKTVEFMGIRNALYDVRENVRGNIEHLDKTINKIERVGSSLREAGQNIRNAFRAIRGKEDVENVPKEGRSKTDMLKKPFEAMRENYLEMEEKLTASIDNMDRFEERVILDTIPKDMTWDEKLAFTDIEEAEAYKTMTDSDCKLYESLRYEQDRFLEEMEQAEGKGEKIAASDKEVYEKILRQQMQKYTKGIYDLQAKMRIVPKGYSPEEYAKAVTKRCHDIRMEIQANGFKPSPGSQIRLSERIDSLMETVDVLDTNRGRHHTLQDIRELAENPDIPEIQRVYAKEVVRAVQETGGWLGPEAYDRMDAADYSESIDNIMKYYRANPEEMNAFIEGVEYAKDTNANIPPEDLHVYDKLIEERAQSEVISNRTAIRQDIRGNGFKATKALVANMEHLNEITGKHNTLQDVKGMAKNPDISAEVKETVNEVVDNLQQQEMQMQAPEPPAVEPA